jgi:hypothetical protein
LQSFIFSLFYVLLPLFLMSPSTWLHHHIHLFVLNLNSYVYLSIFVLSIPLIRPNHCNFFSSNCINKF